MAAMGQPLLGDGVLRASLASARAGMRRARCTRSALRIMGKKWCWRLFRQRWQLLF
jgi:hypothetical protein